MSTSFFIKLRPRWYYHIGQNGVLEDEQIFLHYQERYLAAKGGSPNFTKAFYLPTKADSFVFELRQWVNQYNAESFPGETFPPLLPKEELLERYHSHTQKCSSCRGALANIQKLKFWSGSATVLSLASMPILAFVVNTLSLPIALIETAIPLIFGGAWLKLSQLERQFYDGRVVPPRNLPEEKQKKR